MTSAQSGGGGGGIPYKVDINHDTPKDWGKKKPNEKKLLQSTPLESTSPKSIMISWNIPISSNFHVKLEPLSRCRLSRHDGQVDLLILPQVGSVL